MNKNRYLTLLRGSYANSGAALLNNALNLISGMALAIALGPIGRGLYQEVKIFVSVIPNITNFNMGAYLTSIIDVRKINLKGLRSHLLLSWVASVILFYFFFREKLSSLIIITFAIFFPILFLTGIVQGLLIRAHKNTQIAIMSLISVGGASLLIAMLYVIDKLVLESAFISVILCSFIAFIFASKYAAYPNGPTSIYSGFRKLFPVGLSSNIGLFLTYFDQIAISWILGSESLGLFIVAQSFASVTSVVTGPLLTFAPQFAREDFSSSRNVGANTLKYIGVLYLLIVGLAVTVGSTLLAVFQKNILGEQYASINSLFPILVCGLLLYNFNDIMRSYFVYLNDSKTLYIERGIHISSVVLGLALLHQYSSIFFASSLQFLTQTLSFVYLYMKLHSKLKSEH